MTSKLWESNNPNERVWINADKITEDKLKQRGVEYTRYNTKQGSGYLVPKSEWRKIKDFNLCMLGTPVTLVVDAATVVVVVGVASLMDPSAAQGVCDLLNKACN